MDTTLSVKDYSVIKMIDNIEVLHRTFGVIVFFWGALFFCDASQRMDRPLSFSEAVNTTSDRTVKLSFFKVLSICGYIHVDV